MDAGALAGDRGVRAVLTIGGSLACLFTLALGILGMAGEYRDDTLGQALLAAPARWPVVLAKVIAHGLAGLTFGLVALVATFAVGVPGLASEGAGVSYSSGLLRAVVTGTMFAAAMFAVVGVGLAAVVRDQRIALGAGLGWALLVDSLAMAVAPGAGRLLPGGAVTGLLRVETDDVLAPQFAGPLLAGYALVFAIAGTLMVRRRDLT